jgi:hypothetical protein
LNPATRPMCRSALIVPLAPDAMAEALAYSVSGT